MAKRRLTMLAVTRDGTDREKLEALALKIAESIDSAKYQKDIPPLARQYRETMAAIRELDGGGDDGDDEIDAIIGASPKTR